MPRKLRYRTHRGYHRLLRQPGSRGEEESDAFLKLENETQWVKGPHGQSLASRPQSESWAGKGDPAAKRRQRVRELCGGYITSF